MGVGGSATTDGGAGLLRALGVWYRGGGSTPLPGPIPDLDAVDLVALDPRLAELELRIACDVTNPLLGEHGAAAVYGPQKGAWPEDVAALDAWLARFADLLEAAAGTRARDIPGAGAAGGTSFGLLCLAPRMRSLRAGPGHRRGHGGDRLRRRAWRRPTWSSRARAASTSRPRSARRPSAWRAARPRPGCRAWRSAAVVTAEGRSHAGRGRGRAVPGRSTGR